MTCDFCRQEKLDSQPRPLLRVVDDLGYRTVNPFHGRLCDSCYDKAQLFGTAVHGWVLNRQGVALETVQNARKDGPHRVRDAQSSAWGGYLLFSKSTRTPPILTVRHGAGPRRLRGAESEQRVPGREQNDFAFLSLGAFTVMTVQRIQLGHAQYLPVNGQRNSSGRLLISAP